VVLSHFVQHFYTQNLIRLMKYRLNGVSRDSLPMLYLHTVEPFLDLRVFCHMCASLSHVRILSSHLEITSHHSLAFADSIRPDTV